MSHMHFGHLRSVVLSCTALAMAFVAIRCADDELSADQIFNKSQEHFAAVNAFEANITYSKLPDRFDPGKTEYFRFERPNTLEILNDDGSSRMFIKGDMRYIPSISQPGKWSRTPVGESSDPDSFELLFPQFLLEPKIIEADADTYVIEAFTNRSLTEEVFNSLLRRFHFKFRKSDFALVEHSEWDSPINVQVDENGVVTVRDPDEVDPQMSHRRTVTQFSNFRDTTSILTPAESEIAIDVLRIFPEDGETIWAGEQIGYYLSEAAPIMELTLDPPAALIPEREKAGRVSLFTGRKMFSAEETLVRKTTYTATLKWGDSQDDLFAHSWTFTIR